MKSREFLSEEQNVDAKMNAEIECEFKLLDIVEGYVIGGFEETNYSYFKEDLRIWKPMFVEGASDEVLEVFRDLFNSTPENWQQVLQKALSFVYAM